MKPLNDFVDRVGRNNLIVILCIVVLLILGFLLLRGNIGNPFQSTKPTIAVPTPRPTTVPGDTIMITFRAVPNSLTIKKGHLVNFANFSGVRIDIEGADAASKDLNVGILEDSGTSNTILLKTPGTYKYIDKLNPKITGGIIVTP
jgi:plastocyanin